MEIIAEAVEPVGGKHILVR